MVRPRGSGAGPGRRRPVRSRLAPGLTALPLFPQVLDPERGVHPRQVQAAVWQEHLGLR